MFDVATTDQLPTKTGDYDRATRPTQAPTDTIDTTPGQELKQDKEPTRSQRTSTEDDKPQGISGLFTKWLKR